MVRLLTPILPAVSVLWRYNPGTTNGLIGGTVTDIDSTPTLAAVGGITILGVATGLDPVVVGVSFFSTVAAISYMATMTIARLFLNVLAGTLFGSVGGPVAVSLLSSWAGSAPWAKGLEHPLSAALLAALIGFLSPIVLPALRTLTTSLTTIVNKRAIAAAEKEDA